MTRSIAHPSTALPVEGLFPCEAADLVIAGCLALAGVLLFRNSSSKTDTRLSTETLAIRGATVHNELIMAKPSQPNGHGNPPIEFFVDKKRFASPPESNPIKGARLRELGGITDEYDLWMRGRGQEDDLIVEADEDVSLYSGAHFYSAKKEIAPGIA